MSESLYVIEDSLRQLAELREAAKLEGDSEALKVIDQQIAEYLDKEAKKVSSYVALIQSRIAIVEACGQEIERIQDIEAAAAADIHRLKSMALGAMQRFGVQSLIDKRTGQGLRRQANGGLQQLEIPDPREIPRAYTKVYCEVNLVEWEVFAKDVGFKLIMITPDAEAIRKALAAGSEVHGAKLLERGEHVRVI
jgi:Siphovirus Gp157